MLSCLSVFGIQTTSFAAVIGAAGFAIGLAFQGTLSSFSSGVMLLTFRPFKVGDYISAGGHEGTVAEFGLFATSLATPDNRRIVLPNSAVYGSAIENYSYHSTRRVDIAVGTDYSASLDRTREILMKAAEITPGRLESEEPRIVLSELGGSSIDWKLRVWCKTSDYLSFKEALIRSVKLALDEAGIGIPFPQMDVHVDQAAAS